MPNTRTRERLRNLGSRVPGPGPGQAHQTPGATAKVQVTEGVEGLKRATSPVVATVKVQVTEAAEDLRRAISVVAEAVRLP